MGEFRKRRIEARLEREGRFSFGWLAEMPDVIVTVTIILLYRLIHILAVVGFDPEIFYQFWCAPHRLALPLHPAFMMLFLLLGIWILLVIFLNLWRTGKVRWGAFLTRLVAISLLGGYIYVLHEEFGGFACSIRSPAYFNIEAEQLRRERYDEWQKRFIDLEDQ